MASKATQTANDETAPSEHGGESVADVSKCILEAWQANPRDMDSLPDAVSDLGDMMSKDRRKMQEIVESRVSPALIQIMCEYAVLNQNSSIMQYG